MKAILKGEVIKWLLSLDAITDRVADRVYARRIDAKRGIPAIVVRKSGERNEATHGGVGMNVTMLSFCVFATSDRELESIKQQLNDILDAEDMDAEDMIAHFFLSDDSDFDEYQSLELNEWAGVLEYECHWQYKGD